MPDVYFFCPRCKQRLEAPPEMAGTTIECPACKSRIKIPASGSRRPSAVSIGTANTFGGSTPSGGIDLVGRIFGKDRVTAKIAVGGMGSVWKTEHTELKAARALKTMPEGFSSQQDLVQRFHQEAKVLAQLHHPNIAQIHDFGSQDGIFYFIMEYLPGGSLRAKLQPRGTRLPWRAALRIADEVCAGLEYAHGKGIVHRDVKPENILFDEQGRSRIADFGLGKILGDVARTHSGSLILGQPGLAMNVSLGAQATRNPGKIAQASLGERPTEQPAPAMMTAVGQIVGTMDYMSPEQRRGSDATPQVDIYSLGVTLFEMLTGELPSGMEVPSERTADCPPAVDALVKRMLAAPDRRFPTAISVREEIARVMAQPGGPSVERPGQTRKIVAGIAIVVAVLLVGVFALWHRTPNARETERITCAEYANFVNIAKRAESEQQWTVAKNGYADALKSVEGVKLFDNAEARIGLARAEGELANRNTTEQRQLRSTALVNEAKLAESKRQWKEAITAYEEAGKLFDSPDARSGAVRARSALAKEIDGLIEKARTAETSGQWGEAVKAYEAALAWKDDPAMTIALNKANLALAKERDDLAAKARQDEEARKRADFELLMADGAKAQANGDLPAAKSAFERAAAAAPANTERAQAQTASASVAALAKVMFNSLDLKAIDTENKGDLQGAADILEMALPVAPDLPSATRVRTHIVKIKYDIAHPPKPVNQTVTLSWVCDPSAEKRFPSSAQILDGDKELLGEVNIISTRAQDAYIFANPSQPELGWQSKTVSFGFQKSHVDTITKLCDFRFDDPVGQTRTGRAEGLFFSGCVKEIKRFKEGPIKIITIQVSVTSSAQSTSGRTVAPAPADAVPAQLPDEGGKKTLADLADQEKKAAFDDLMQQGKDAEERKDWQSAKDIYIKALAAAPDTASTAQVRTRGSQVVAQLKSQAQLEQLENQPQQEPQVNQTPAIQRVISIPRTLRGTSDPKTLR